MFPYKVHRYNMEVYMDREEVVVILRMSSHASVSHLVDLTVFFQIYFYR